MRLSSILLACVLLLPGCAAKTAVESLVKELSPTAQVGLLGPNISEADRADQRNSQQGAGNTSTQQVLTTQDPALIHAIEQVAVLAAALAGVWVLAFMAVMLQLGARLGELGRELSGLREDTRQNTQAVERIPADTARELARTNGEPNSRTPGLQVV